MGLCRSSPDGRRATSNDRVRDAKVGLAGVIDLKMLRDAPDVVRRSQLSRGEDPDLVDVLLSADAARRAAVSAADTLRAEQKIVSKGVAAASADQRPALLAKAKDLAAQVKSAEAAQLAAAAEF